MERSVYQGALEKAKLSVVPYFSKDVTFSPPPPPASNKLCPLQFWHGAAGPNNPLQPGPVYFLTPRKYAIFGVCHEAIPRQINYLIDEAVDMGKGSNAIVSMLHHFFAHHGLGKEKVHLHADNCSGQNRNTIMVQYLLWRVMTDQHMLSFIHDSRPCEVQPWLVLQSPQKEVQEDEGRWSNGSCWGHEWMNEWVSIGQHCSTYWIGGWECFGDHIRLAGVL